MKKHIAIFVLIIICKIGFTENIPADSLYFGLTPPGDSAIVFAPGVISLGNRFEQSVAFSPDGKEIIFGTTNSNWDNFSVQMFKFDSTGWSEPEKAGFLGASGDGITPIYAYDNSKVFFTSSRPQYPPVNIWMSNRTNSGWTTPEKMEPPVNSSSVEFEVSVSESNTLYFSSKRPGMLGTIDIYYSKLEDGEYKTAVNMGVPVNTKKGDDCPFIACDESYLIFASDRAGSLELDKRDLYISYRKDDNTWTNPKNMGPKINTTGWDIYPYVSPDNKFLFFTRRESWENSKPSDIFWISTSFIDRLKTTNFSPYVKTEIPDITDTLGNTLYYTIPDSVFFDDDGNETLTLAASLKDNSDLPGLLSFNPQTKTLSGVLSETGKFDIKITATDTAGASVSDVFKLTVELTVASIDDLNSNNNIKIFPNPVSQTIQIKGIDMQLNNAYYELTDINGKTIKQGKLNSETIDVSELHKGIFMLNLITREGMVSEKIVIK